MKELLSNKHGKEPGILADYLDYLSSDAQIAEGTAYNYYMCIRYLAKFLKHCRKNMQCLPCEVIMNEVTAEEMLSITEDEWDDFLDNCRFSDNESAGAHAVRISVVRGFYKWLSVRERTEAPDFIMNARRPKGKKRDHIIITPQMEEKLYEHLAGEFLMRNACIVRLCMHCGLGLSEICSLDLEDIDLEDIHVQETAGTRRTIHLDAESKQAINDYLSVRTPPKKDGNPFFVSAKEGRLRRGAVQKMLRKAVKHAGPTLRGVTLRDMQMTARRRMMEENGREAAAAIMSAKTPYYISQYGKEFLPAKRDQGIHSAARGA